jgi:hypothetical protein
LRLSFEKEPNLYLYNEDFEEQYDLKYCFMIETADVYTYLVDPIHFLYNDLSRLLMASL